MTINVIKCDVCDATCEADEVFVKVTEYLTVGGDPKSMAIGYHRASGPTAINRDVCSRECLVKLLDSNVLVYYPDLPAGSRGPRC